ncbi:MAG TPA: DNA polymerase I [Gemmatimonadales bacterium]|nr:DNA polymerase I [Gemmatimonadales bacterium]
MSSITPPKGPRLFLVDGYALIYRAFFALISRPLTTSRGENTSAAWGIANFLQRLLEKHRPEYLGWVHDSGLSFRTEKYPDYKATREKLTNELQADFDSGMERIKQLLAAYHIPVLAVPGYEADDVIGTLARQGAEQGVEVVVVSGDKDFHQLVRDKVWLLNPGRGGPASVEEQWVGVANGSERLGVEPQYTIDFLAMVGDTSDNVPGVPGIGEKTAKELIETFGDLENILANAADLKKKRPREALVQHADQARLSRELVTILDDVDIALNLESLRLQQPDTELLRDLFVELEFHSMARDAAAEVETSKPAESNYETVETVEDVGRVVRRLREVPWFAFDTETVTEPGTPTVVDPLRSILVGISVAAAPGEAYYFPLRHRVYRAAQGDLLNGDASPAPDGEPLRADPPFDPNCLAGRLLAKGPVVPVNLPPLSDPRMAPLRELLEDAAVAKVAQNAKYDMLVLRGEGITLRGLSFDTMLASYVLDPGRRSHSLDLLALEFLKHQAVSYEALCGKGRQQIRFDAVPVSVASHYACEDADLTFRLREVFEPQLESHELTRLLHDIEMPLIEVLAAMESAGVSIDAKWFASLKSRFRAERERVEQEIYREAGEEFNIASNPQLRVILFEKLELPIKKRTSTGPSTDASVLQELADEGHAIPSLLMEYRELAKLENTYLDTLPALVNPHTGRLHTSFNQTVASTGRLSSSDPNLQNIPIRRELGRDIRRGFIPREGWKLLAADYSQIELRLLAHLSADPAFVAAFNAGGDIHRETASIIFGVPVESVTSEMRARAKTINFATIYGQGAFALSRQLKISMEEAREFISTYFERFAGIREYLDSRVTFAREHGYVQTLFGRRRYIPELRDRNFNIRAFGERTAANSPIQGSAADLIKLAMIHIHNLLEERGVQTTMLLQVHDELVFEVPPDELSEMRQVIVHEMEHAAELDVPLVVDVGVGDNWLETKE